MKQLYLILIFTCWGCYGQLPVKSLYNDFDTNDVYYKDTFNDYNKFEGTWKYTNGTTSLTITLNKRPEQQIFKDNGDNYLLDFMVGGYKYIENGVEKINTVPLLSQSLEVASYGIWGYILAGPNSYYCLNCQPDERVLILAYSEPGNAIRIMETEMLFQRADSGGVQKLKLDFRTLYSAPEDVTQPVTPDERYTIPFGEYILTKVN